MKSRTHDCPYLQGKCSCVNKRCGKQCVYSDPSKCEQYLELEEMKAHYSIKEELTPIVERDKKIAKGGL